MQGRIGDANTKRKLVDTMREGESGTNGESSIDIYIYTTMCKIDSW